MGTLCLPVSRIPFVIASSIPSNYSIVIITHSQFEGMVTTVVGDLIHVKSKYMKRGAAFLKEAQP